MTAMTTLGAVMEKVERLSEHCHDRNIKTSDILFDSLETVDIAGHKYPLRQIAQRSAAYRLGIPLQYLQRCPEDVQRDNLNYWIRRERNDRLFFRFSGNEVRAIFTSRYIPTDNLEILDRLMDQPGYSYDTQVHASLDENFMCLSIPDSNKSFTIGNSDRLTPGVSISNSEVGLGAFSISAFILRLVCTNGLISKDNISASYRHISTRILQEFPNVLSNIGKGLDQQKNRLQLSLESRVDDLPATVERLNQQFLLTKEEREAVAWAIPLESGEEDPTMFTVVNCFTKSSQFPGLAADTSYKLQRCGGMILEMLK